MIAVPPCDGIGSTGTRDTSLKDVSGSGHTVGSGTAGPVRATLLVGVGNTRGFGDRGASDSSTTGPVGGATLLAGVGNMRGSGNRGAGDSSTAGPVDGTTLLAGVGNMRGSENRGAGDLGDGATAGDRSARGVDRAVL
jgi:hypothetical protein